MESLKGWVSGQVQGVGFRYFVLQCAEKAGLTGYANNLPDGRVEVLLQGPAFRIDTVKTMVEQGPTGAVVKHVEWEACANVALSGFTIG